MGIEDLNLDLDEYADRVLVVTTDTSSKEEIASTLEKRSYQWSHAESLKEAAILAEETLYDLMIFEHTDLDISAENIISSFRFKGPLKRLPVIYLSPEPHNVEKLKQSLSEEIGESGFEVLSAPLVPTDLVVKATLLLRLRKREQDDAQLQNKVALQNLKLRDLTNRFKHELNEAKDIQESILPDSLPKDPTAIFAASYIPLEAVGGDLYDIWKISDGTYGLFIGDVTGHGLPAAFIGAMTHMAMAYASKASPEKMFEEVNNGLAGHMPEGRFVTAAAAIYESASGRLLVARAGHPPPYIFRKEAGVVEEVEPDGFPLGVLADMDYELFETTLGPGDKFLMYTDGIIETVDMDGNMLGMDGFGEFFLSKSKEFSIVGVIEQTLEYQEAFSGGRILKDDNTFVGLERKS